MKIPEYLESTGVTYQEMANAIGCNWRHLWSCAKGRINPSTPMAMRIQQYTNGKVKVHEIRTCNTMCLPGCPCSKGGK
jgi:hypothetical protein